MPGYRLEPQRPLPSVDSAGIAAARLRFGVWVALPGWLGNRAEVFYYDNLARSASQDYVGQTPQKLPY